MQNKPNPEGEKPPRSPDLKDVEPGSDADETPMPETDEISPDPKQKPKREDGADHS